MFPKEHGAWNVLWVSLVAGWLTLGSWNGAALSVSCFFVLGFILRAPLNVWRQWRVADPAKATQALGIFLLECVAFLLSGWWFWAASPPTAIRWVLLGVIPLGAAMAGFYLWKKSLRFFWAEALGFLGLPLLVPVIYLCGPQGSNDKALWLYALFAGQSLLALTYVKVRQGWLAASRNGVAIGGARRWRDGRRTVALHGLFVLGILACPHGGGWLALGPLVAFLRALGGVSQGRPGLPIMKLGLLEMAHSLVYMILTLFTWKAFL